MKTHIILLFVATLSVSESVEARSVSFNATECQQRYVNPGEETLKYRHFSSSSIENTTNKNIYVYCPINLDQSAPIESVYAYFNTASKHPHSDASCTLEIRGMANPSVKLSTTNGVFELSSRLTMKPSEEFQANLQSYQANYQNFMGGDISAFINCKLPRVSDDALSSGYGFTRMMGYVVNYQTH
ncbi:hypothetical protein [Pseudoalteromonas luteoviolacea]|uniref:Uncharacterized protein n=1 Tax=Pseudoalteromonas luteoviolacea H33 TaxID=1365251 RepID=A0A162AJ62_9GAMM|nr:hypothetical protein [Pseudoalteromonas luteoviolacea]KZN50884.1 hypothetical protein N476_14680 [Pseudoalteromonas luteoviolacea H33]KZN74958.1 hypothetical protein N477_20320 [Pseudoalteromonas luteoviolacea H33-S]MBQ4879847.1 hypothetical protein [Pseudoalteromonas luteoviolacea]MBQ4908609.1 hypothetical protein [Pseudoalteromonas luteoviolacea]